MNRIANLKMSLLGGLIAVGAAITCTTAHAATEKLLVAGGCFWCVESDFESVSGVSGAVSGFAGGASANPTYKQVTKGGTGHYEAVEITFDNATVSRDQLLNLFFRSVDPTDAGGQFCDRGDSYRTAIFYANDAQKSAAEAAKADAEKALGQKIVTPILPAGPFYKADASHQDYYKGSKVILTRFGPKKQSSAYVAYRQACGRDDRVHQLWGAEAPFTKKYR